MLFVSVFAYVTLRTKGIPGLQREVARGNESDVPAFRTLAQARELENVGLHIGGACSIAKARCMAAGEFLRSPEECDVWLQCDEDVYAPAPVLAELVARARETRGVAIAAMPLRDGSGVLNVEQEHGSTVDPLSEPWAPVHRAGLALAAIHREVITCACSFERSVFHVDGRPCPVLFFDDVSAGQWRTEDVYFCDLVRGHVALDFMISPDVVHDGVAVKVEPSCERPRPRL